LWNLAVNRAYSNTAEIETALEREMFRLAKLPPTPGISLREAAMRSMIRRSGLFIDPKEKPVKGQPDAVETDE
jgi:hypothetical protein